MLIALAVPDDVYLALGRFADEKEIKREEAAVAVLREWLFAHEYLKVETMGDTRPTEDE